MMDVLPKRNIPKDSFTIGLQRERQSQRQAGHCTRMHVLYLSNKARWLNSWHGYCFTPAHLGHLAGVQHLSERAFSRDLNFATLRELLNKAALFSDWTPRKGLLLTEKVCKITIHCVWVRVICRASCKDTLTAYFKCLYFVYI